jgi:hypothetical protein
MRSVHLIEGVLTTIAWSANKRLSRSTAELSATLTLGLLQVYP